jgi:hypothetical protein
VGTYLLFDVTGRGYDVVFGLNTIIIKLILIMLTVVHQVGHRNQVMLYFPTDFSEVCFVMKRLVT